MCAQHCVRLSQEGQVACWVITKYTGAFLNLYHVKPYSSSLFWCLLLQFFGKWIDPIDTSGQIRCISLEGKRLVSLGMWYKPEQAFVYMLLGKVDSASDYEGDTLNNISWYGKAAARSTWSKVFSTHCKCARWIWPHSPGCWQDVESGSGRSFPLWTRCSVAVKQRRRKWEEWGLGGGWRKSTATEGGMPGNNRKNSSSA